MIYVCSGHISHGNVQCDTGNISVPTLYVSGQLHVSVGNVSRWLMRWYYR